MVADVRIMELSMSSRGRVSGRDKGAKVSALELELVSSRRRPSLALRVGSSGVWLKQK